MLNKNYEISELGVSISIQNSVFSHIVLVFFFFIQLYIKMYLIFVDAIL